jgi:hypothetical protein
MAIAAISVFVLNKYVAGGFKNYLALLYFICASIVVSAVLSSLLTFSEILPHQYDLNNCIPIAEINDKDKQYLYNLVFDGSKQKRKIKSDEIVWNFFQSDTDLEFNNIIEYKEVRIKIRWINVELKTKGKKYQEYTLFISDPKDITCLSQLNKERKK